MLILPGGLSSLFTGLLLICGINVIRLLSQLLCLLVIDASSLIADFTDDEALSRELPIWA
jgi:hypothetical protein